MGNSLFPFETSGLLGWVLGMVGLVLFGVLLMVLIEREPTGTSSLPETNAGALELGQARLNALGAEIKRLRLEEQQRLEEEVRARELEDLVRQLVTLNLEEEDLEEEIEFRQKELRDLKLSQDRYALAYRDWLWKRSKGRKLPKLQTKHEKTYQSVEILEVSNSGLRIRHATGTGVLPVSVLPDSLRQELQLDLLQSQRLKREKSEEQRERARKAREERAAGRKQRDRQGPDPASHPSAKRLELVALLEENRVLSRRLTELSREIAEAESNARSGRARSVPGSLETWGERAVRLAALRDRLRTRLDRTRARIQVLDPGVRHWFP